MVVGCCRHFFSRERGGVLLGLEYKERTLGVLAGVPPCRSAAFHRPQVSLSLSLGSRWGCRSVRFHLKLLSVR